MTLEDTIQSDQFAIPDGTMELGVRLFSVLSSEDAVRIFLYAEKGIASSTQAVKDLGLTQKRYYSRLKGLIDVGLIEKVEGTYMYTAFGKVVRKLGFYLMGVLNNIDRIELINKLYKAKSLSPTERSKVEELISEQSGEVGGLLNYIMGEKGPNRMKVIITFNELVDKLVEQIDLSQKSILLASRHVDTRVIDASLKANKRGVILKVLVSKENLSGKLNMLRVMLSPRLILSLIEFFGSSMDMTELIRENDLTFSFCIIDDRYCFFEFPSIEGSKFSIAFYIDDEKISTRFTELFHRQWEMGEINKMQQFSQKLKE